MKKQKIRLWRTGILGVIASLFFLVGGMMLAEAASNEDYELKIPLGLDEDAFKVPEDNPLTRDKVNEYAFDVMGEMPEERMLLALLEAYQIGRHKYYSLLNTIINSLNNFDNPEIKSVYLEIAQSSDFPSNIRLKAFKGLTRYSDPEVIDGVVELLNDPSNYIYYNEIVGMLHEYGVYNNYQDKLRMAAYNAMKKEAGFVGFEND